MAELSQPNFTWLDGFGTNNPSTAPTETLLRLLFPTPLKPKREGRRHQGDSPFYISESEIKFHENNAAAQRVWKEEITVLKLMMIQIAGPKQNEKKELS